MPIRGQQLEIIPAATVGINATSIDTIATSNWISVGGNQIALEVFHDYGAATGVTITLFTGDSAGNAYTVLSEEDSGSGLRTLSDRSYSHNTGADKRFYWPVPILAEQIQIKIVGNGSPSGDAATIRVLKAKV